MFRRRRSAEDFAEEIKSHLELEADELKLEGWTDEEARWKAHREFGNIRAAQEQFYLRGRHAWLDKLLASLEARRNKALRAIAEHRGEFAQQQRNSTGRTIDGKPLKLVKSS